MKTRKKKSYTMKTIKWQELLHLFIISTFQSRHRLVGWIKNFSTAKKTPTICFLQEIYLTLKGKNRIKGKVSEKVFQASGAPNQARVYKLISNKADFKRKLGRKDKEGCFILIKEQFLKNVTVVNIHAQTLAYPIL
jgi:hypothetical protein